MPFDENLAQRIRKQLSRKRAITEKNMFGGLCFLIKGNMLCGVEQDNLVIRVGPEQYETALKRKHARPMDFTGRPLKGFIYVSRKGYQSASSLRSWIDIALDFAGSLPKK